MNNEQEKKFKDTLKKASLKIKELEAEITSLKQGGPVAVIGMACRFPGGAHTPEAFWNLLEQGKDAVTEIPGHRWDIHLYYDPDPEAAGKMITREAALLDEIDTFDAGFFGISPLEAESLDPQQRLLLELSWEALENAGENVKKLEGSRTGVFIGMCAVDYVQWGLYSGKTQEIDGYMVSGISYSGACGRIAYFFNFHGPAVVCDTACSSSLTALHNAITSLNAGESDLALVGGVSLLLLPGTFISFSRLKIISPDGRSRTFDRSANGFGRGEGGGMLVLKRLDDARRDGDSILALVKSTALNQDGKSNGFLAPNGVAQQRVIVQALKKAGLAPEDIDYVETHGTGTPLGDSVEIQALAKVFKDREKKLLVGSVKTNIGHLDAAAGMASLIKVILAFRHKKIPGNLHFQIPNEHIPWEHLPISVVSSITAWEKTGHGKPRRAGISSFGFTGTNAHAILEEAPPTSIPEEKNEEQRTYHLLTFSTKKKDALLSLAEKYKNHLAGTNDPPSDICYSTNITRTIFAHRLALVGTSREDLIKKLGLCFENPKYAEAATSNRPKIPGRGPGIVFMFTGQGSQYTGMARELFLSHPLFRQDMQQCDNLFEPYIQRSILDLLYEEKESGNLDHAIYAQPVIFAVEYALARLWQSWGITPAAVIGHSIGEYAAACCAGVLALEHAVRLVALRGKFMESLPQKGKMVGILTDEQTAAGFIHPYREKVSTAAVNAPKNVTISGESAAVDAVLREIKAAGIFVEPLTISHPFHSILMDPYIEAFQKEISGLEILFSKPLLPMISNKTGQPVTAQGICTPVYWATHLKDTVRFYDGIKTLANQGYRVFIEIGGIAVLSGLAGQCITEENAVFIPSLRKGRDSWQQMLNGAAELYLQGIDIDWHAFNQPYALHKVTLPNYPFSKERYWLNPKNQDAAANTKMEPKPLPDSSNLSNSSDSSDINPEIKEMIHIITGVNELEIEEDADLFSFGMDSLMLVRLKEKIAGKYGVEISLNEFFTELNTISKIVEFIRAKMPQGRVISPQPALPPDLTPFQQFQFQQGTGTSEIERIMALQMKTLSESMSTLMNRQLETLKNLNSHSALAQESPRKQEAPRIVNFRSMKLEKDNLTPEQQEFVDRFINRYIQRSGRSKQYIEKYREIFSDWINSLNFRLSLKEIIYPIVSTGSQGARLVDLDGNEYIDLAIGYGVSFFGHRPSFVLEAIKEQAEKGFELGPQSNLAGEVATLIRELTGVERVAFCNTGSEAVMAALRLARTVTGRKTIVRFAGSYHGTSDGVLAAADEHGTFPMAPGITPGMVEDIIIMDYGSQESLAKIKEIGHTLAAVLVEPVQSRKPGFQPGEFLKQLRIISTEVGAALIFDEMITGFRIHPGGAQAHFGIQADIVTYGKIIGGGLPLAVVSGRKKFLDAIDGGTWNYGDDSFPGQRPTFFAGTYCKHPLSMAAARAVLQHMKTQGPALQETVNQLTQQFTAALDEFFKQNHVPIRMARFGSLFRFESFGKYDPAMAPIEMDLFFYLLMERGVFTWESRVCCFSTAHTREDAEYIINAVKESIRELRANGFAFHDQTPSHDDGNLSNGSTLPLTHSQERMYVLSKMEGGEGAYHQSQAAIIQGNLDIDKMKAVFMELMKRHDSLRISFESQSGQLKQKIHFFEDITPCITYIDYTGEKVDIETLTQSFIKPFDLAKPPLIRFFIARLSRESFLLVTDAHHIIADGLSMNILAQEIKTLYEGKIPGPPGKGLKDYIAWEQQYLESKEYKEHEKYWRENLAGEIIQILLPADFTRPVYQTFEGSSLHYIIDPAKTMALKKIVGETHATLYMFLLACFNILLTKLTGEEDIILLTPAEVRGQGNFNNTVGLFINAMVLRNQPAGSKPFNTFVTEVKHCCLAAYEARRFPFDHLVRTNISRRETSHNPLSDINFVYERAPERELKLEKLTFQLYKFEELHAPFDLNFEIIETGEHLNIDIIYRTRLFKKETIAQWYRYFEQICDTVMGNPGILLKEIDVLTVAEKNKLLITFNDTGEDFPAHETLHALFEDQAEQNPGHMALVGNIEESQLTYGLVNEYSNRLAYTLLKKGIQPDNIVAIMMERSLDMVIGILGILKAGGAYMPIDPVYPQERIDYMLKDSNAAILLTDNELKKMINCQWSTVESRTSFQNSAFDLPRILNSNFSNLAYIIYTSGSTGKPKGVPVEHRSVVNVLHSFGKTFAINKKTHVLQGSNYTFDPSVEQVFGTLGRSGTVYIIPARFLAQPVDFRRYIDRHQVELLDLVPALYQALLADEKPKLAGVRALISGGESLDDTLKNQLIAKGYTVHNHYGPTECTIEAVTCVCSEKPVVLGRPIANMQCYILDRHMQPVPIGITGQLCLAGIGLARGYLNKPELTAEKFGPQITLITQINRIKKTKINKSFSGVQGAAFQKSPLVFYKTGDLARWLPDGNIEFQGRLDTQVKIRGARIELEEICQVLNSTPGIKESVVISRKDEQNNSYLAAYYVGRENPGLREYVAARLPTYMIPTFFIPLERLPRSSGGKIDRNALPGPGQSELPGKTQTYRPPTSEIEKKLAALWQKVLGLEQINVDDNFFEKGGNSLNGINLITLIQQELSLDIPFHQLFLNPTIAGLAEYIMNNHGVSIVPIPCLPFQEYYDLSHSQKRMWLLNQLNGGDALQNMIAVFEIRGPIQVEILDKTIQKIVQRHEILRTRFIQTEEGVKQQILEKLACKILTLDLSNEPEPGTLVQEKINQEIQSTFDLTDPPLFRFQLLQLYEQHFILLCNMHHIIADGWSLQVMMMDINYFYNHDFAHPGNEPAPLPTLPPLPPLTIQYKDYAAWQNHRLKNGLLKHNETYWLSEFKDDIPHLQIPTDFPRPEIQTYNGDVLYLCIDEKLTLSLREFCRKNDATLFMFLYAALNVLLYHLTFQTGIVVGFPTAGRSHYKTLNLMGHFLNMLPLYLTLDREAGFNRLLQKAKTKILEAFENQDYPLDILVEKLKIKRDFSRGALFDVQMIFNNQVENNKADHFFQLGQARTEFKEDPMKTSYTDIEFHFNERNDQIPFYIRYNVDLFKKETIEAWARQWHALLEFLPANPHTPLKNLSLTCFDQPDKNGPGSDEHSKREQAKMLPMGIDF